MLRLRLRILLLWWKYRYGNIYSARACMYQTAIEQVRKVLDKRNLRREVKELAKVYEQTGIYYDMKEMHVPVSLGLKTIVLRDKYIAASTAAYDIAKTLERF